MSDERVGQETVYVATYRNERGNVEAFTFWEVSIASGHDLDRKKWDPAMTAKERSAATAALADQFATYLRAHKGTPLRAAIKQFCKDQGIGLSEAEVALSTLFSQGRVTVDREMELHFAGAA